MAEVDREPVERTAVRVCMVAFTHYTSDSRVRREAEALAQRGDTVDVISLEEEGLSSGSSVNGVTVLSIRTGRYRGGSSRRYMLKYLSFFFRAAYMLTRRHFIRRYDVVQVHTMPDFMVFTAILPRLFGAKVLLDVHDLMPELYMSKSGVSSKHPIIRLITWIECMSVRFADRAIAVHEPHRQALLRHGCPNKFDVVINLPDLNVFGEPRLKPRLPDGKFRLMYHGTIAPRHGLAVAIEAVGLARESIPGLELCIYGDGDDRARLVALVEAADLGNTVKFSDGMVPLKELPARIRETDLGIVPLLDDVFTRYMLPVKLLEYVGLGVPVLASRTDTIIHYCSEDMVALCEPGNAKVLAARIVELYSHPEQLVALVDNAAEFRERMTWEQEKSKYYAIVDRLVKAI